MPVACLCTDNWKLETSSLQLLHHSPARPIAGEKRHSYPVADEHADEIAVHRLAQMRDHLVPALELHFHQLAGQQLNDDTLGVSHIEHAHGRRRHASECCNPSP